MHPLRNPGGLKGVAPLHETNLLWLLGQQKVKGQSREPLVVIEENQLWYESRLHDRVRPISDPYTPIKQVLRFQSRLMSNFRSTDCNQPPALLDGWDTCFLLGDVKEEHLKNGTESLLVFLNVYT